MEKSDKEYCLVFLKKIASEQLDKQYVSRFIHSIELQDRTVIWIRCQKVGINGPYLHITQAEPLDEKVDPTDFLLPHEHVLFVSYAIDPDKFIGFQKGE